MSEQGPRNAAQAEAEALLALEVGAWRVWQAGSSPLPAAYARWCGAEVERATAGLRNRAEAAEAEVARLKAMLESQGPRNAAQAEAHAASLKQPVPAPGQVWVYVGQGTPHSPDGVILLGAECSAPGFDGVPWRTFDVRTKVEMGWIVPVTVGRPSLWRYEREATFAERAAAGLAPEAPAQPQVLPEHLAFLNALIKEWADGGYDVWDSPGRRAVIAAAKDANAAVARRDGGAK